MVLRFAALLLASWMPLPSQAAADKLIAARNALAAWLKSDHTDSALLDGAVSKVLDAGPPAFVEVATLARTAQANGDSDAGQGLDAVITHVTVGFLAREHESGMTYAGQYDALRALQPFVGKLLLRLLIQTPEWFSAQDRYRLALPLRDVFPDSPGTDVVKQLRAMAEDTDSEPQALRQNLAFTLAQWGDRALIEARIAEVTADSNAPDVDAERRAALRYELADIHYTLRDYARAAQIHVDMLRQAEASKIELRPVQYYNAACCLARSGANIAALDELARAVELMRSARIDPSHMLERKLFECDPDLASVRGHERFTELLRAAFGNPPSSSDAASRSKG